MPSVYLAGHILGLSYDEATAWRDEATQRLGALGYSVYAPMRAVRDRLEGYAEMPTELAGAHAFARDTYDVKRADVVVVNLLESDEATVGTTFELGMAWALGKFVIVVIPKTNWGKFKQGGQYHPFIQGGASVIVHDLEAVYDLCETLLPVEPASVGSMWAGMLGELAGLSIIESPDLEFIDEDDTVVAPV